jgi:hypothetical protein
VTLGRSPWDESKQAELSLAKKVRLATTTYTLAVRGKRERLPSRYHHNQ